MKGNLYLIRGLPGSGKSTFARTLVNSLGGVWYEADHFFMENGEYKFLPEKLHRAHQWCMGRAEEAMAYGVPNVVVSNTFTKESEMAFYISTAQAWGYKVTVLVVENRHGNGSVHDVPEETMAKMRNRFSIKL